VAVPARAPGPLPPCVGADGAPQARPAAGSLLPATEQAGERARLRARHRLYLAEECRHRSLDTQVCGGLRRCALWGQAYAHYARVAAPPPDDEAAEPAGAAPASAADAASEAVRRAYLAPVLGGDEPPAPMARAADPGADPCAPRACAPL